MSTMISDYPSAARATEDSSALESHPLAVDMGGGLLADSDNLGDGLSQRPLLTAVVTTHDRCEQAIVAIESVIAQSYRPLEVLVIEDGTTSGVEEWIASENHDIRYIRHETNQGLAGARNTALSLANGEYVAFLDDDDRWKPVRIEQGVILLQEQSAESDSAVGVTYCAAESRKAGKLATVIHPENDGDLAASIRAVGPSTVESAGIFSKGALVDVGGYDETLSSSVDHDIWMALAKGGYAAIAHDEPLVITTIDFSGRMTTDTDERIAGVRQYVEKWRPTYYEWFGKFEGERRIQRYFARTIARLAGIKLVGGDFGAARRAIRAVFNDSDQVLYNVTVLFVSTAEFAAKRFLPPTGLRMLSRIIG